MPRAKPKARAKPQFDLKGFINCDLDKSTKELAKKWVSEKIADFGPMTEKFLDEGSFKVSFSFDKYNECFQASATCVDDAHDDYGYCLTARGPDVWSALGMLFYKHFVVLDGSWQAQHERVRERDVWG